MPHQAAGILTEPPVSVPIAPGASSAETATPEPLEDPPGVLWTARSHGLRSGPTCVLLAQLPIANPTVCGLPRTTVTAALRRPARVTAPGQSPSRPRLHP